MLLGDIIEYNTKSSLTFQNKTIVSRLVDNFHANEGICFPLTTQYSLNATIFEWTNNVFYSGKIRSVENVANLPITARLTTELNMTLEAPRKYSFLKILTIF